MRPSHNDSPLAFVAIQAALHAGQILRKGFGSYFSVATKINALDLVTEFDKASEESIINFIRSHFPSHAFLAEESGESQTKDAPVLWIIDPLDGTLNFAHHIPFFAISIAAYVNNHVEVGVIYQPNTNELFVAHRGHGAYLNGTRMHVSTIQDPQYAVGATGFPYGMSANREKSVAQFEKFLDVGNPIRIVGSAAINLAYVASGRFDTFWGTNLSPWDVAAGKLLVEEAGGQVSFSDGTPHDMFRQNTIVASNGHLHQSILDILK